MTESQSYSSEYSYSYTASEQEEEELPLMWRQITRIPVDALWKTDDFSYMTKVLDLASRYEFNEHDVHLTDAKLTALVGSILKLVATKCTEKIRQEQARCLSGESECALLKEKVLLQNKEVTRLRSQLDLALQASSSGNTAAMQSIQVDARVADAKAENDELQLKLRRSAREVEELRQKVATREDSARQANEYYTKMQREYSHLVTQFAKEKERHSDLDRLQRKLSEADTQRRHTEEARRKLELELGVLRHEKKRLEESLHKTEDTLQVLKRDTLNDMDRAQNLMRKKDEFWEQKTSQLQERLVELESQQETSQRTIADLERELEDCKADLDRFQQMAQPSVSDRHLVKPESDSDSTASSSSHRGEVAAPQERRVIDRLERENDSLLDAVRKLEAQNASVEEEKGRLRQILNQYEQEDNGLAEMRHQLEHLHGIKGNLEQEVTQLKQRLNSATDTLAYTKALEELCRGLGVTKEELNSLRPQNSVAYNEVDTLREEVNVLKEEVEWLEKERRHWMDKVRLQPLMDTKLRFQLGLSADQLRQLDDLVEQMRLGADVVEESENSNFREKYFQQLEARRRDAEQFNEFVKKRIDEAITQAFHGVVAADTASAVSALKDHIDVITSNSSDRPLPDPAAPAVLGGAGTVASTTRQLQTQVHSLTRRIEQSELSLKDTESTIASLKERLAVVSAERDLLLKERNQYRDAIFDAAGIASATADANVDDESDEGGTSISLDNGVHGGEGDNDGDGRDIEGDAASPALTDGNRRMLGLRKISPTKWAAISATLREQLSSKDALIASFAEQMKQSQNEEALHQRALSELQDTLTAVQREKALLVDQVASLNATNEDSLEQLRALQKLNNDLREAAHVDEKELLQKVVLLRRREAHLLQRLRRAQAATTEASATEQTLRLSITATLEALKEQLAGSTGYVLPPSTTQYSAEQEMLSHLQDTIGGLLTGKLFREDTRFIAQLQRIYLSMETSQEISELRTACRLKARELEDLQRQVDARQALPLHGSGPQESVRTPLSPASPSARDGQSWETEATTWRQKYTLCAKRYEDKEREVELLEKDLDDARAEVLAVREQLRADGGGGHGGTASASSSAPPAPSAAPGDKSALNVRRLEKDVARLKSVNLSLIQLSLDLQGRVKALEVDLDGRDQEITLIKDSGSSRVVSDFVSAAIREHAALRRQSELALIQVKRLKVQLAASEANYHVVANEATSYKLSAYRLYRRYVDETAATIDYLRAHQRNTGSAVSARRVEAMAARFRALTADMTALFRRNKSLATQLSDESSAVVTLQQQVTLLKATSKQEREDLLDARLKEARATTREAARQLTESKEDSKHAQSRASRLEEYVKQLDSELARLEFDTPRITALSDQLIERLHELRESILQPPEANQHLAVLSLSPSARDPRLGSADPTEPDVAVREYKAAVLRQMELTSQCDRLKTELEQCHAECRKHAATISEMQDEVTRLEGCVSGYQMQIEAERKKAEARESRLLLAHDNQASVSRRATEHNVACLQDLLQKKEATIKSLEEQLEVERRKYVEHQYEEAARMERLHETMFRENSAMVDRFKEAIEGVSDSLSFDGLSTTAASMMRSGANPEQTVVSQLQALTAETIRLRSELKRVRSANVALETQLAQRIDQAQSEAGLGVPTVDQLVGPQLRTSQEDPGAGTTTQTFTAIPSPSLHTASSSSTDTLAGIIQYQNTMIASLRERELSLTEEIQRESLHRTQLEQQLQSLQERHVEQGGTLDLLTKTTGAATAGSSPLVQELRAQLASLEQELRATKEQLAFERHSGKRLQVDAQEWQEHLSAMQTEVAAQQVEVERSKQLAALNQSLREDLNAVKEQNDKLVLAVAALKQKLLDEVAQGGESKRQRQQEVALAQRMSAIQQESAGHLHVLERRVRAVQKELDGHVEKEKDMLRTNEECQRAAYKMHHELRTKDREIAQLREALTAAQSAAGAGCDAKRSGLPHATTAEAGTQVLPTGNSGRGSVNASTLSASQWDQKENLHQLSTLRGQAARLEKDWRDCQDQLLAEKETTRSLRVQIQSMKKQREDLEISHALELARLHQQQGQLSQQHPQGSDAPPPPRKQPTSTTVSAREADASSSTPASAALSTLEAQNDALRRQLTVDTPARINELEHRLSRRDDALRRMATDLARMQTTTVTEVLQRYETTVGVAKSVEDMESLLLQKSNELLDLRFAKESLQLRVNRLEEQLRGGGGLATDHTSASSVTATTERRNLETVIENLRVVIQRLQVENKNLATQSASTQRYRQLLQEVIELRELATDLAAENARLERSATRGRRRAEGATHETDNLLHRLSAAQAATRHYQSELQQVQARLDATSTRPREGAFTRTSETRLDDATQFGSAPPPLPAAPFLETAATTASLTTSGVQRQRRLSGNTTSVSTERHSDLPHHHLHSRHSK